MNASDKNRMYEIEKKSKSLFFLGLICAAALTLTAFEWQSYSIPPINNSPYSETYHIIEPDLHAVRIEIEAAAVTVKKSRASLTQFLLTDLPDIPLQKDTPEPLMKIEAKPSSMKPIKDLSLKGKEPVLTSDRPSTLSSLGPGELPYSFSCAAIKDPSERFACTEKAISEHLKKTIHIPNARTVPELPGLFYVQFIVDQYGAVGNLTYSKEIPTELKKEVDKAFASIPFMNAASVNGRKVKVIFAIPLNLSRME